MSDTILVDKYIFIDSSVFGITYSCLKNNTGEEKIKDSPTFVTD